MTITRTTTAAALAAAATLGAALAPASEARAQQQDRSAQQQQQRVERLLGEAEQAMQRGDGQAARQALQQARRAMEGDDASAVLPGEAMEFLRLAQRSIDQGALRTAWIALGRAETRLLTRVAAAPQGEQAAQGGAIGAIRSARQALTERDVELAAERTERAMALARRGDAVGSNAPGAALTGAGAPGPGQPLTGGGGAAAGDQARQ
ncbi:hypothetical protein GCM10009416_00330 [Craurococcus roseus]|uniref:Uncharacterized protein n=1 Tax=Craurococcus roseus TaxID=77585 RepID=A0ABN1EH08_9PROT